MDSVFYHDTREPHITADIPSVTLAATMKALVRAGDYPPLGANYFARPGKRILLRAFGRITTGATPGNLTMAILMGTGADANGVTVCTSAAFALTASQTSLSWEAQFEIHCRSTGPTGTLFGTGRLIANNAVIATSLQPVMIPASLAAASGAIDLTTALFPSLQAQRSGSTAETMQVHDFTFNSLN